jgi:hypothetical protein
VDIGVAKTGRLHPDDDLAGSRLGHRSVFDDQRLAEAGHYCCAHGGKLLLV